MSGEMNVTVVGSIAEPTLRFTQGGKAVLSFSMAHNNRVKDGDNWVDGEPTWFKVTAWEGMAENGAETLEKGMRVIVVGRMSTRKWTTDSGEERTSLEIQADSIGPDLRWATAQVTRAPGGGRGGDAASQSNVQRSRGGRQQQDPWETPVSSEPPF